MHSNTCQSVNTGEGRIVSTEVKQFDTIAVEVELGGPQCWETGLQLRFSDILRWVTDMKEYWDVAYLLVGLAQIGMWISTSETCLPLQKPVLPLQKPVLALQKPVLPL